MTKVVSVLGVVVMLAVGCTRNENVLRRGEVHLPAAVAAISLPCPEEMALIEAGDTRVCVDRYEAAITGVEWSAPLSGDTGLLVARPAKGVKPKVNVSEPEAEAACINAGKRLCTAAEWVAACRGRDGNDYPYGKDHRTGACNDARSSPVATTAQTARLDDKRLAEAPNGIEPGGAFSQCVTSAGIHDMHGNVHEWVSDGPKPDDPRFGQFHGGFFADGKGNGAGCAYKTTAHFKTYRDYSIGFRCCADATTRSSR